MHHAKEQEFISSTTATFNFLFLLSLVLVEMFVLYLKSHIYIVNSDLCQCIVKNVSDQAGPSKIKSLNCVFAVDMTCNVIVLKEKGHSFFFLLYINHLDGQ